MATGRRTDPRRLDVRAFAAEGGALAGEWPLPELPRLAAMAEPGSIAAAAPVTWTVRGTRATLAGAGPTTSLVVDADAVLSMQCQRCLQAVTVPLHVDRRLFFVDGEDVAAALDADSDDDVLATPPALDLRNLVEDELLLALPLIPRHETCPHPLQVPGSDADLPAAKALPFAGLAVLKRGARHG